jgi:hypothetical protein
MVERRRIARTRIFAPAIVIPRQGSRAWDCFVRDITSLGARLEFPNAPVLPTNFELTFDCARTVRVCHLIWRMANEVGLLSRRSRPVVVCSSRPTKQIQIKVDDRAGRSSRVPLAMSLKGASFSLSGRIFRSFTKPFVTNKHFHFRPYPKTWAS